MNTDSIAPCGINCATCYMYLRKKNTCSGCRSDIATKREYCAKCSIKNCKLADETASKVCHECSEFPCKRLKQLDNRYLTKYKVSLIGNLQHIKSSGLQNFLESEREKWRCNNCGGTICVHRGVCLHCNVN